MGSADCDDLEQETSVDAIGHFTLNTLTSLYAPVTVSLLCEKTLSELDCNPASYEVPRHTQSVIYCCLPHAYTIQAAC